MRPYDMNPFPTGYGPQQAPMQNMNGSGMDVNQQPHPQQGGMPQPNQQLIDSLLKRGQPGTNTGGTVEPAGLPDPAGAGGVMPDAAMSPAASMAPETAGIGGETAALGGGEMAGLGELGAGAAEGLGAAGAGLGEAASGAAAGLGEAFGGASIAELLPFLLAL